jgi:hypothetical protein
MGVLCIRSILSVFPSDLPGVNPATLNGMVPYYRLMSNWSGLGDSTELSRVGLSHQDSEIPRFPVVLRFQDFVLSEIPRFYPF